MERPTQSFLINCDDSGCSWTNRHVIILCEIYRANQYCGNSLHCVREVPLSKLGQLLAIKSDLFMRFFSIPRQMVWKISLLPPSRFLTTRQCFRAGCSRCIFWKCSVRISAGTTAVLTEAFRGFIQSFQANSRIVPWLWYDRFLPDPFHFIICLSSDAL
jgi:hypothetical protein